VRLQGFGEVLRPGRVLEHVVWNGVEALAGAGGVGVLRLRRFAASLRMTGGGVGGVVLKEPDPLRGGA
jgi:hypothetical protein